MIMETGNRRRMYQTPYVNGSAAKKLAPAPAYEERVERQERKQEQTSRRQVRKPQVGHGIDLLSMLLLVGAIAMTLYVCIEYLQVQADITKTEMEISAISTEIAALTAANDAFEESLDAEIDWDYVYQTAIGELGMVYPNNNTVVSFEKSDDGYVRHYKDIPE